MRVIEASPEPGFRIRLRFDDGTAGEVDLSDLAGRGVFAAWREGDSFMDISLGSGGEVSWACGVDLCADALYLSLTGKRPDDIFPALRSESRCA
jgi:hypothetical protein